MSLITQARTTLGLSFNLGVAENCPIDAQNWTSIMDTITFIGLLGGTMGMFVGLSFFDINSVMVDLLFMLTTYTRKQKKAKVNQM